jgi:hypothetical protein
VKVPKFKTKKEEMEFWDTHDSTDYLEDFEPAKDVVFVRPKKEVISLRLEPKVIKNYGNWPIRKGFPHHLCQDVNYQRNSIANKLIEGLVLFGQFENRRWF